MANKMLINDPCFITFKRSITQYSLPEKFTFPFCYEPHPLCELAVQELQQNLLHQTHWQHNFGLNDSKTNASGKMFGVLIVKNTNNEIGYLTAFSGKFCDTYTLAPFVPSVHEESNTQNNDAKREQVAINQLTQQITQLKNSRRLQAMKHILQTYNAQFHIALQQQHALMASNRKNRKIQRTEAEQTADENTLPYILKTLANESIQDKKALKTLKHYWQQKMDHMQCQYNQYTQKISNLSKVRHKRSSALQKKLFEQYQPLNKQGEKLSLPKIFQPTPQKKPPAGAGDCAAPKLLQHAFKHNYSIIAMAEFWWGISPKSEIRQHKNYYPACSGKCEPILNWMLKGIALESNPLLTIQAQDKEIDILYQDEAIAIINKPNELLSVPGKYIEDCVYHRMRKLIPSATGPLIVHRLDMSTSGLMVIALTKRAHKQLQKQFIQRTIKKRYVALLNGYIAQKHGKITLPLAGDFNNKPRQLVCETNGKPAETLWEVIEHTSQGHTKMHLTPVTGRTHQLRVHCAHPLGLNTPMVGDDLYGTKDERLCLHAESLTLFHPITRKELTFEVPAPF